MPPQPKFTREEIVEIALKLVSEKGIDALTARELGNALGSSSRPIFTAFKNMEEVQDAVHDAAMKSFESYNTESSPDFPLFKQIGMKMILFAQNEPKLYQLLFMRESSNTSDFGDLNLGETAKICIKAICSDYGLNVAQAERLFKHMWIYTYGVATLSATGVCRFPAETLGNMLSEEFHALIALINK